MILKSLIDLELDNTETTPPALTLGKETPFKEATVDYLAVEQAMVNKGHCLEVEPAMDSKEATPELIKPQEPQMWCKEAEVELLMADSRALPQVELLLDTLELTDLLEAKANLPLDPAAPTPDTSPNE